MADTEWCPKCGERLEGGFCPVHDSKQYRNYATHARPTQQQVAVHKQRHSMARGYREIWSRREEE